MAPLALAAVSVARPSMRTPEHTTEKKHSRSAFRVKTAQDVSINGSVLKVFQERAAALPSSAK
jgi:hypothetical protein